MAYNDVSYDEVATGTKLSGPTKNRDESAPIVDGAEVLYDGLKYDDDEGTYQFRSVNEAIQELISSSSKIKDIDIAVDGNTLVITVTDDTGATHVTEVSTATTVQGDLYKANILAAEIDEDGKLILTVESDDSNVSLAVSQQPVTDGGYSGLENLAAPRVILQATNNNVNAIHEVAFYACDLSDTTHLDAVIADNQNTLSMQKAPGTLQLSGITATDVTNVSVTDKDDIADAIKGKLWCARALSTSNEVTIFDLDGKRVLDGSLQSVFDTPVFYCPNDVSGSDINVSTFSITIDNVTVEYIYLFITDKLYTVSVVDHS